MNVYGKSASKSYTNISLETLVSTANPHQLITLLIDATLVAIVKAKYHMQKQEIYLTRSRLRIFQIAEILDLEAFSLGL